MKTLLTGATGLIGGNLLRLLLREGWDVRVLERPTSDPRALAGIDVERVTGDLCDAESLRAALKGCDRLFHVAGAYAYWAPDPNIFYRVNTQGTRILFSLALREGVEKVVYTSTMGTIGPAEDGRPADEREPFRLWSSGDHYTRSKYLAELGARRLVDEGLPLVIVNPGGPIGPWDWKPTPLGRLVLDFLHRRIPFRLDGGFNVIDVEDVALGHLRAAQKGKVGERYLLTNANFSLTDFLELLARVTSIDPPRRRLPYPAARAAGAVLGLIAKASRKEPPLTASSAKLFHSCLYYASTKAVRELDLPQSPIEDAVRKGLRWFREWGYA